MSRTAVELLEDLLKHTLDADAIRRLVAPDAIYVSLNQSDADHHRIMPWAGTHRDGPQGIHRKQASSDSLPCRSRLPSRHASGCALSMPQAVPT